MLEIRRAVNEDSNVLLEMLSQIARLHYEGRPDIFKNDSSKYTEDDVKQIISDNLRPIFVAVELGEVIGYVFCEISENQPHPLMQDFKSLYIDDFFIKEDKRGNGTGRILFEYIKKYAEEIGCHYIDLNVWEFNKSAIEFYEKCGMTTQRRHMELKV